MWFLYIKIGKRGDIMAALKEYCPVCNEEMQITETNKSMTFRGIEIVFQDNVYVCPGCQMEVGTTEQTAEMQRKISDAYRKASGLLTGEKIREERKRLGLSQKALADKMTVGIASIKRWEGGLIQSKAMDKALRSAFWNSERENSYTGNRRFSISRVKLVIKYLEMLLNRLLLLKEDRDRLLFTAKYLWYADFIAHRETGKSMTGATYATLPYGPQFNNYRELIVSIKEADEKEAEPLNLEEKNILERIAKAFPNPRNVYDTSHLENIWKKRSIGEIIPYSDSSELKEL